MGNESSQPGPFHSGFIQLLKRLQSDKDPFSRRTAVQNFVLSSHVTLDDTVARYMSLTYPMKLPLETTERGLAWALLCYIQSANCTMDTLDDALFLILQAIPILEDLNQKQGDLENDLYSLLSGLLSEVFDDLIARNTLSTFLLYFTSNESVRKTSIYYQAVAESPVLKDVVATIRQILNQLRFLPEKADALCPYTYLDLPDGKVGIFDELLKSSQVIEHLIGLIPQRVLVVKDFLFLTKVEGMTLYTNTMIIRESYTKDLEKSKELTRAKCMVTMLHEMSHLKRRRYYSQGQYFKSTPEKIQDQRTGKEAGLYVENELFGGALCLSKITPEIASLLLDPGNFNSVEKHHALKDRLKPFLQPHKIGFSSRIIPDSEESAIRCFTHRVNLRPISAFQL